ncbi:MAG: hypothetical protein JSV95_05455 [Gemmatimonadota bacterium]|nr:MAG: hypothetical protein JSV95_05455 [Gemmatimonadota bacterium]
MSVSLKRKELLVAAIGVATLLPGCGGSVVGLPVPEEPTEVTLWDFRASPLVEASAFSWIILQKVRTDQTDQWDFGFSLEEDGTALLFPRGSVLDAPSTAGLQFVDETFEQLVLAPDSGYVTDEPVSVRVGDVLAGVSRRDCGVLNLVRFGKLEILEIDEIRGTLTFKQLANPNCENRNLVPGEVGET